MHSNKLTGNELVAYRAFQSKRHANTDVLSTNEDRTMPARNTSTPADTKLSLSAAAMAAETPEEFDVWVNKPENYTRRKINGEYQDVPYTCSLTCNVPTDIYHAVIKAAAGDAANLSDGALTDYIRGAIWVKLGYTQEFYDNWSTTEKERINKALRERMSGVHSATAEKQKQLVAENQSLAEKLAALQEQLAALMAAGASS